MMRLLWFWIVLVAATFTPPVAHAQLNPAPSATSLPPPSSGSVVLIEGMLAAPDQGRIPLAPPRPILPATKRSPTISRARVGPPPRFYHNDPPPGPARSELFEAARESARARDGRSLDITDRLRDMENRRVR